MDSAVVAASVAYFSMEIAIAPGLPTYSGGLGVLAGDTIRAAADLGVPMVAVTLLFRKGYVWQTLSPEGDQLEAPEHWEPEQFLARCGPVVEVPLRDRMVRVQAWKRIEVGVTGHSVPILFLDTDVIENDPSDRRITDSLYGGDQSVRVLQELVLGIGGVRMLRALGYADRLVYHLNEGHAAFLLLELVEQGWENHGDAGLAQVRSQAVFTTHTPVAAGHDVFARGLIEHVLSSEHYQKIAPIVADDQLNMTKLALRFSGKVNAVSRKHRDVTQAMFPGTDVIAITNGVHAVRWTGRPFAELFDRHIPGWRERSDQLRHAMLIPTEDIQQAHREAREELLQLVQDTYGMPFGGSGIVLGFARRATEYKRATLLFRDVERLKRMARHFGTINVLFAGKAHPRDGGGKHIIREIHAIAATLGDDVRVAFLPNYDVELAAALVSGVDLWLNTPRAPLEASGTSGMKAALNGIPSVSIADGWWLEGGVHGSTGWVVKSPLNDGGSSLGDQDAADAEALYRVLESEVLPCFFHRPDVWAEVMRNAIAINGSFFNTHRMVEQYSTLAYQGCRRIGASYKGM